VDRGGDDVFEAEPFLDAATHLARPQYRDVRPSVSGGVHRRLGDDGAASSSSHVFECPDAEDAGETSGVSGFAIG
jgi:hypothetical protein